MNGYECIVACIFCITFFGSLAVDSWAKAKYKAKEQGEK